MAWSERKIKNEPCVHFMKFCASTAEEEKEEEWGKWEREREMEWVCLCVGLYKFNEPKRAHSANNIKHFTFPIYFRECEIEFMLKLNSLLAGCCLTLKVHLSIELNTKHVCLLIKDTISHHMQAGNSKVNSIYIIPWKREHLVSVIR